jgi:hypothetical protein
MMMNRKLFALIVADLGRLSVTLPLAALTVAVRRGWKYAVVLSSAVFVMAKALRNGLKVQKVSVMAVGAKDFDEFDKVIVNDHIENIKLYAPNEARQILLTVWINMKAEVLRKELNAANNKLTKTKGD